MNIPYRTRQNLKRAGIGALAFLVALLLVGLFWFMWLDRFVVYTRDRGAVFDMSLSEEFPDAQPPSLPQLPKDVPIYYNEGANAIDAARELQQMVGYYADTAALRKSIDTVTEQVKNLPKSAAVMLDVKNAKGAFFYSSAVNGYRDAAIDPVKMDQLIAYLKQSNVYAIARLPALRDYQFGLTHTENGLPVQNGGYLWADADYCYWLNPAKQGTVSHLIQIVSELKSLGFDEVVFDEFRFPVTDKIAFAGDKAEAIATAADTLVSTCSTNSFTVSFMGTGTNFPLPEGRCRLYLRNIAATDVEATVAATKLEEPATHLVFLAQNHDTRYEVCSVLRPLDAAH